MLVTLWGVLASISASQGVWSQDHRRAAAGGDDGRLVGNGGGFGGGFQHRQPGQDGGGILSADDSRTERNVNPFAAFDGLTGLLRQVFKRAHPAQDGRPAPLFCQNPKTNDERGGENGRAESEQVFEAHRSFSTSPSSRSARVYNFCSAPSSANALRAGGAARD